MSDSKQTQATPVSELIGEEWPEFSIMQFLINEEEIDFKQLANSEIEESEPQIEECGDGQLSTIEEGECEDEEENLDELFAMPHFEPMKDIDDLGPVHLASRPEVTDADLIRG